MRPVKIKCKDCINTLHLFMSRIRAEPEWFNIILKPRV